ncbi:MAG: hypothetical protein Q7S53_05200 [bacterium]|nr:hypothetical protein [bacterium]
MKISKSFKKTKVKIIFAGLLIAVVAGVTVVVWTVYKSNNNPEVAQVEPSKATKNVKLDSEKVTVTESKPVQAPAEAKKDPKQKQNFAEKDFGFSFSYPGSWSSLACGSGSSALNGLSSVLLSPEGNSLPGCGWLRVPETAQINFFTVSPAVDSYEDAKKQNTAFYTSHNWTNVEINGKQMLKTETTWSGAGGLIPAGTKTVDYLYLDSGKNKQFKATYWLRGADKDHLSEFEDLIKTLSIDL